MHIYSEDQKDAVRLLRVEGLSLGEIHAKTHIPKTTIRSWISDISQSEEQKEVIKQKVLKSLQKGRIKSQRIKKEKKGIRQRYLLDQGVDEIGELTKRDIFIAGVALYWAEGFKNKHEHRLGFCNSDPGMVRFYLHWLESTLAISKKEITARLTINKLYESKTHQIEKYWSDVADIPLAQFTKPFYQNTVWKKQYDIDNYHGVLRIHVKDSLENLLKMRGWIEGLKHNTPG